MSDANLLAALNSMMRDWEIETVRDAAAVSSADAALALVDSGSTERGLETARLLWKNGVEIPFLVIGDAEAPAGTPLRVLVRPFTLQDLIEAVTEVSAAPAIEPVESGVEPAGEPEPVVVEEPVAAEPEGPAAVRPEGPAFAPAEEEPAAAAQELPEAAPAPEEEAGEAQAPSIPTTAEAIGLALRQETESEPEPVPPSPVGQRPTAPVRPPQPAAERAEGKRRFLRRRVEPKKQAPEETEDPVVVRLKSAIHAGKDFERLLIELPVLAQPRAMAHAFLAEVVALFGPQVAAVYASGLDGSYSVIAAHGLSTVEAGMRVLPSQPLFLEIAQGLEAVLISPLDLAQGLVAGIGGARTEALMAAPLEVDGACHAIAIVGRQQFSEFDLDLLSELAEEAAPGLAVAQMLDRLRCM
jgi:hypothetical protein